MRSEAAGGSHEWRFMDYRRRRPPPPRRGANSLAVVGAASLASSHVMAASADVTANCAAAHYAYTQLRIWQAGTQPIRETCSSMQQRGQILGLVG